MKTGERQITEGWPKSEGTKSSFRMPPQPRLAHAWPPHLGIYSHQWPGPVPTVLPCAGHPSSSEHYFFAGHVSSSTKSPLPPVAPSGTESHVFTPQLCTWNPASLSAAGPEDAGSGYVLCLHKRGWEQGASSRGSQPGPLDDYSGVSIHQLLILAGDRKKVSMFETPIDKDYFNHKKVQERRLGNHHIIGSSLELKPSLLDHAYIFLWLNSCHKTFGRTFPFWPSMGNLGFYSSQWGWKKGNLELPLLNYC